MSSYSNKFTHHVEIQFLLALLRYIMGDRYVMGDRHVMGDILKNTAYNTRLSAPNPINLCLVILKNSIIPLTDYQH